MMRTAVTARPEEKPRKPTRPWAAFVLSGIGK
jgi:hypothetical protein